MKCNGMVLTGVLAAVLLSGSAQGTLIFNDGGVHEITTNSGSIGIYDGPGGEPTTVILSAGNTNSILVFGHSIFRMTGGVIADGHLGFNDNSVGEISGGIIDDNGIMLLNWSQLTITGGVFNQQLLRVFDQSSMTLVGRDFTIDGNPVAYGRIGVPVGMLSGTFDNGSIQSPFFTQGEGAIFLVPEPGTIVLLGLGGWGLFGSIKNQTSKGKMTSQKSKMGRDIAGKAE